MGGGHWALSVYPARYLGCYQDNHDRSLDGYYYEDKFMTATACVRNCESRGYLYAGLEVG